MKKSGFTLIELLVVIAIIGLLSSIVLGQLNESRKKAESARIKLELSSLRRAAAIYYENQNPNGYGGNTNNCTTPNRIFTADTVVAGLIASIDSIAGVSVECRANTTYFVVSANLVGILNSNADNWCVDNAGASKAIADPIDNSATACP